MYLVKKEVMATSIKNAMIEKGVIYSIEIADEKFQPVSNNKKIGFSKK